jgi:hypothetical protein
MPQKVNPLLERIHFPGETFQLPSRGVFYGHGELADHVKDGEVRVLPMTTIDELQMKSPDMLFSGAAIVEVFSRCIPDVLDPMRLFAKDIDFLMICLRKVSYGDEIQITYDHECKMDADGKPIPDEHSYIANITSMISGARQLDPTKKFVLTFENEQVVTMSPIRFGDFLALSQKSSEARDQKATPEAVKRHIFDITASLIDNVDGVDDKEFILEWLNVLPRNLVQRLSDAVDQTANWGPSYDVEIKCKSCGKKIKVEIPLNPLHFFM